MRTARILLCLVFALAGGAWTQTATDEPTVVPTRCVLDVRLGLDSGLIAGRVEIELEARGSWPQSLPFDLNPGLHIDRFEWGGQVLDVVAREGGFAVRPGQSSGRRARVSIAFSGSPANTRQELGYASVAIGPDAAFASWLSTWYPVLASSRPRCPTATTLRVPRGLTAVANGVLSAEGSEGGDAWFRYEARSPVTASFAVGRFQRRVERAAGVSVGSFLSSTDTTTHRMHQSRLSDVVTTYVRLMGRFPYESYWLVELPAALMGRTGGSSEQGLAFLPSGLSLPADYVDLPTLSHEIAHAYWGNWVVGDGVLMSEGLANALSVMCLERLWSRDLAREYLLTGSVWHFQNVFNYVARYASRPERDPRLADSTAALWDLHAVANTKGTLALIELRDQIGERAFLRGLRAAMERHPHEAMTLAELRIVMERASGGNLGGFFEAWFARPGLPREAGGQAFPEFDGGFARWTAYGEAIDAWFDRDARTSATRLEAQLLETPDEVPVHAWLAHVSGALRDWAGAERHATEALRLIARDGRFQLYGAHTHLTLARALEQTGRRDESAAELERAIAADQTGIIAGQARARLIRLRGTTR